MLRTRLAKLEQYHLQILKNEAMRGRLSPKELEYAKRYRKLVKGHFHDAFLRHLPSSVQSYKEMSKDVKMIPEPDLDKHVFIRVKEDIGTFELQRDPVETVSLALGDIYLLRYRPIQPLLESNQVELV